MDTTSEADPTMATPKMHNTATRATRTVEVGS